jgi:hypothetical protein
VKAALREEMAHGLGMVASAGGDGRVLVFAEEATLRALLSFAGSRVFSDYLWYGTK